jgi:glutamate 5-kinase
MKFYEKSFAKHGQKVAQILLTHNDIAEDYERVLNVRNTISTILEMGAVPVINENDTVSDEEVKFGDNDTLAAKTASALGMDLLLILSDVDGLYDSDPRLNPAARLVSYVKNFEEVQAFAGESSSSSGAGGMRAKVRAAKISLDGGVPTWIVSGKRFGAISDALLNGAGGTVFYPTGEGKLSAKRHWIRHVLQPKGRLILDEGATKAILKDGKSLLASGISSIDGNFSVGDGVNICDSSGAHLANGIVNYDRKELERIKGRKSSEIEEILGFKRYDEVIHRDNLVLIGNQKAGKE